MHDFNTQLHGRVFPDHVKKIVKHGKREGKGVVEQFSHNKSGLPGGNNFFAVYSHGVSRGREAGKGRENEEEEMTTVCGGNGWRSANNDNTATE